jgi:outer membrane protein assembly factor BamE (lipoprotein component of BamABCDE complex)
MSYLKVIILTVTSMLGLVIFLSLDSAQYGDGYSYFAFRKIENGMSMSEVTKYIGEPLSRKTVHHKGYWMYDKAKMRVYFDEKSIAVDIYEEFIPGMYFNTSPYRKFDNVKEGMTRAEISALLGEPRLVPDDVFIQWSYGTEVTRFYGWTIFVIFNQQGYVTSKVHRFEAD